MAGTTKGRDRRRGEYYMAAVRGVRELGLRLSRAISLVGFDDSDAPAYPRKGMPGVELPRGGSVAQ